MSSTLTRNPNLDLTSPAVLQRPKEAWQANLGRCTVAFPRGSSWWTVPNPEHGDCPGWTTEGWISAVRMPDLLHGKASEVMAYANGWLLTKFLFASLTDEDRFCPPPYHGLRSPLSFDCRRFHLTPCLFEKRLPICVCVLEFRTTETTLKDLMEPGRLSLTRIPS